MYNLYFINFSKLIWQILIIDKDVDFRYEIKQDSFNNDVLKIILQLYLKKDISAYFLKKNWWRLFWVMDPEANKKNC